jgi:putative ABC transport system substrate-binding protein
MRRREFITLVGGAAAAWPLVARAQQSGMPLIGFLDRGSSVGMTANLNGFQKGLAESGYVLGKNVAIDTAGRRTAMTDCRHSPRSWSAFQSR